MTKAEAAKVLEMIEAHGLADEAKRIAIKELKRSGGRRLIDADALKMFLQKDGQQFFENGEIAMIIDNAPTVDESKTDDLIVLQFDCIMRAQDIQDERRRILAQIENDGVVVLPSYMHVAYIGSKCNVEFMYEGEGGTEG